MLSESAVDKIFDRLSATWGTRFLRQWDGIEPAAVKVVWAKELAHYHENQAAFSWAFENLPESPMNAIEFRALLRRAPRDQPPALPWPTPNPELARSACAALSGPTARHRLAWATDVLAKPHASIAARKMAQDALSGQDV